MPVPVGTAGAHRNISILGNTLVHGPVPGIEVTSTEGLVISGNAIVNPVASAPSPAAKSTLLINCKNVEEDR